MKISNSERVPLTPVGVEVIDGPRRGLCPRSLATRRRVFALLRAALLAPSLAAATAAPVTAATAAAKPAFLIQAEKKYRQARNAVTAAENYLNRVSREEARESQRAMAQSGQWIEPTQLWEKTRAAQQSLDYARELEGQALTELNEARDAARRARVGGFPAGEFQPLPPFWWLW